MPKISQDPVPAQSIKLGPGGGGGVSNITRAPFITPPPPPPPPPGPLGPVHHFSPQMCSPFLPQKSLIRSSYKCTAKAAPLIDILGANWENLGCPYTSAICLPDTTRFQFSKPLFHLKYTLPS